MSGEQKASRGGRPRKVTDTEVVSTGDDDKSTPAAQPEPAPKRESGGKKLAVFIRVAGHTYAPGDTPPAEVAEKITNPKAWA